MNTFIYEKDADGIVTVTMDMTGPVNAMNDEYRSSMAATVERLEAESGLTGVVIASAKKVFFAGGDLNDLLATEKGEEGEFLQYVERIKDQLRRLEKLPVPVVAAINGAALGGGYEICLSCNYRIAVDSPSVLLGLPEVGLGLLPGGGGIVRLVNLVGLEVALPYLLEGKRVGAAQALAAGLIHETVALQEELVPRAKAYIRESAGNDSAAIQPWDQKGFELPGGTARDPKVAQIISTAPAALYKTTRGLLPAPEQILDCAIEATRVDFDTAQRIESRGLAYLVVTPEAKNMINAFFFQMNKVGSGLGRPKGIDKSKVQKLGVLGAGMMGQGIAYVAAKAGIEVVLKDISIEAAEKGKAYTDRLLSKQVSKGRLDETGKAATLALINTTDNNADLKDCELVIEAVFESIELKSNITKDTEQYLSASALWGTNTSSLPINDLAKASQRPKNFIGIHFFSPVDKMPLVEIICGEETNNETLAKAYDFARQIKKTPIVVNDSLGFFTSRTFGTYLDEGIQLLNEGVYPAAIDNLGRAIGMPLGPLAIHDETSLQLSQKQLDCWAEMGRENQWYDETLMRSTINTMINVYGRGGRHYNGGFYEYVEGKGKHVWSKLVDLYHKPELTMSDSDIKDRLLFRQVIETLKCLEQGVLRTVSEANIGSILGIGAPAWTGGYIQFVNTYGLQRFINRCEELTQAYGDRFKAPDIVYKKCQAGELFNDE